MLHIYHGIDIVSKSETPKSLTLVTFYFLSITEDMSKYILKGSAWSLFGGFLFSLVLKLIEEEKLAFGDRNGEFGNIIVGGLHHGEFSALSFKHNVKKKLLTKRKMKLSNFEFFNINPIQ